MSANNRSKKKRLIATGLILIVSILVLACLSPIAVNGTTAAKIWTFSLWGGLTVLLLGGYWLYAWWLDCKK